jgi:hypothetical protein
MLDEADNEYINEEDRVMVTKQEAWEAQVRISQAEQEIRENRKIIDKYKQQKGCMTNSDIVEFLRAHKLVKDTEDVYIDDVNAGYTCIAVENNIYHKDLKVTIRATVYSNETQL